MGSGERWWTVNIERTFAVIFAVVFLGLPLVALSNWLSMPISGVEHGVLAFLLGIVYGILMIEVLYVVRRIWTGTWFEKDEDSVL